jgi:hypothetical protein
VQNQFYGDNRDLVKWGTLLELAHRHEAKHILQVLYYRTNNWEPIVIDGEPVKIADEAIQHFRDVNLISNLKSSVPIEVLSKEFCNREQYHEHVIAAIKARSDVPGIIFLDPDPGLQPGAPNLEHVLHDEVGTIWDALSHNDVLVFYQHRPHIQDWINVRLGQFVTAIGVERESAKFACAPTMKNAQDVAFFYAQKN